MSKKPDGLKNKGFAHRSRSGLTLQGRELKRGIEFLRTTETKAELRAALHEAKAHVASGNVSVRLTHLPKPRVSHFKDFYQQAKARRLERRI